jgi:hypothetical protein
MKTAGTVFLALAAPALALCATDSCDGNFLFTPLFAKLNITFPAAAKTAGADAFCPMYADKPSCCSSAMDAT